MTTILNIVIVLVVILVSMVLHELAHGFTAYLLGDTTAKEDGRLTLNPLKHLDPVLSVALPMLLLLTGGVVFGGAKPVPVNTTRLKWGAWGMALVAIAGPLTNLLLALIGFLIGNAVGAFWTMDGALYSVGTAGMIFTQFVMVNLGFAIFNMIPIPPLDGSRVLYALAPDVVRELMEKMERIGMMVVMAIVLVAPGVISGIMGAGIQGILTAFMWLV